MWARHVEVMLGLWLAISGFIFAVPDSETAVWAVDLVAATLIVILASLSHWPPARRAYLLLLPIALGLVVFGFVQPRPVPRWHQNHILVGLLLGMFAIIPSHASDPPRQWQKT